MTETPIGTLFSVTLDCTDARALGRFWAGVLGGEVAYDTDEFVGVKLPSGTWLATYRVDDYVPPTWSESGSTKQMHLEIAVDDLDVAEPLVVELGATKVDDQPAPDRWRVFLDPAGHPFCLTIQTG